MSRYTTPNAPASEFGQLALGSSSSSGSSGPRMTATTRSMSRRIALASQNPPSRVTAGPSRRIQASAGAPNTPPVQPPSSDDSDEDSDSSDDGNDDDGGDLDQSPAQQDRDAHLRTIRFNVFDICALTEPNNLVGHELQAANGTAAEKT